MNNNTKFINLRSLLLEYDLHSQYLSVFFTWDTGSCRGWYMYFKADVYVCICMNIVHMAKLLVAFALG